jgi:hypothetical protein
MVSTAINSQARGNRGQNPPFAMWKLKVWFKAKNAGNGACARRRPRGIA